MNYERVLALVLIGCVLLFHVLGGFSSRHSPRPLRASLVSSSSTSSFRRALSNTRATFSISPVVPPVEQAHSHNGHGSNISGSPHSQQDPDSISAWQDLQADDPLDMQEVRKSVLILFRVLKLSGCFSSLMCMRYLACCSQMLNSLRSLRNSAAKKRAKVSHSSPDPDSPDSAVRVDLGLDSPLYTSPVLTSSASDSRLSSLSSATNSSFNGIKTRSGMDILFQFILYFMTGYVPFQCSLLCVETSDIIFLSTVPETLPLLY